MNEAKKWLINLQGRNIALDSDCVANAMKSPYYMSLFLPVPKVCHIVRGALYRLVQKKGPVLLSTSQAELSHNLATFLSLDPVCSADPKMAFSGTHFDT